MENKGLSKKRKLDEVVETIDLNKPLSMDKAEQESTEETKSELKLKFKLKPEDVQNWRLYQVERPEMVTRDPNKPRGMLNKKLVWKEQILAGRILCSSTSNDQTVSIVRWSKPVELNWGSGPTLPYFYSVLVENEKGHFLAALTLQADKRRGLFEIIPPQDKENNEMMEAKIKLHRYASTYWTSMHGTKPWKCLQMDLCSVCFDKKATVYLHCDITKEEADAHIELCETCYTSCKMCPRCNKEKSNTIWTSLGIQPIEN